MTIGVDFGHNCPGANTGAVGIRKEDEVIMEVGTKVVEKLLKAGHEVILLKPESNYIGSTLGQRVTKANDNNVDLVISIHFNCSNGVGKGVECFAISSTGIEHAQRIVDEIAALGYANRGVKDGSGLYIVRNTNAPAVLIECCFIDNVEDMNRYNAEDLAVAIVKGITGQDVREEEFDPIGYMMSYRDLVEAYAKQNPGFIEFAKWHYDAYGKKEIEEGRR